MLCNDTVSIKEIELALWSSYYDFLSPEVFVLFISVYELMLVYSSNRRNGWVNLGQKRA